MSQTSNVVNNKDLLNVLSKCNSKMRHSIINCADKNLINTICECILNCMNGNISINNETKIKLKRHKEVLRKISVKKKVSLKEKKKILSKNLNQKGGAILPLLLATVLGGLSDIVSNGTHN